VQVPLEVANLRASRDVAVLDFSYTFGTSLVILLCYHIFFPECLNIHQLLSPGNNAVLVLLMQVDAQLRLPVVLNKFLQPITLTPEEFFTQRKALTVHSLKVQEVVRPQLYC